MKHSSAESSHQDELNGGRIEFLGVIDAKLLSDMSKTQFALFYYIDVLRCNFLSNDQKRMKHILLESSHQGELNGSIIEFFGVVDGK
jgi:hypothetical protein